MLALNWFPQVHYDPYCAGDGCFTITRQCHEVNQVGDIELASEVRQEDEGPLENANEIQLIHIFVIGGNLSGQLGDSRLNLLNRDEDASKVGMKIGHRNSPVNSASDIWGRLLTI